MTSRSPAFLSLILLAILPALSSGQSMVVRRAATDILIDGVVGSVWSTADSVELTMQPQPYYGKPPTQRTVAKLLSTDNALCCLFLCYDQPGHVEIIAGMHDQAEGDNAALMIDTFDDRQTAYQFVVSAAGVRSDARILDDARNRDYSWDGVWFAGTK